MNALILPRVLIMSATLAASATALAELLPKPESHEIETVDAPLHPLQTWAEQLHDEQLDPWQCAAIHRLQANEALRRCRKYVDGWLAQADPKTGLIRRGLSGVSRNYWNGRDAGADNYAFMVLTSALTDRPLYDGRMREMLRTETKLTSRIGALPADYDFDKQGFRYDQPDLDRLIFDGSEYAKDGLMPITDYLGQTPWSERMIGIVDSILEQAPVQTPLGRIPTDNVEVNGEMMQVLSRLCFMTGDGKYLDMGCRIADYYLLGNRHPTRNSTKLGLRDHNCELISGLIEVYAACCFLRKEKAEVYREPIHVMLDRILEVGINEHGLMYDAVNPQTGEILKTGISDNWGYNYNGFYTVYLLDGVERYRQATRHALSNLKPHYGKYPWERWSSDGIADSVEGAINLLNRESDVEGVSDWIDANMARMLLMQQPDGVIEGWHGDGNYARTAIMWALWKQQGVTIQPWREDVKLGAVRSGDTVQLVVTADQAWQGRLVFDSARHKTVMKMPLDYPRINQFPEWFTVETTAVYRFNEVHRDRDDTAEEISGETLLKGQSLQLQAGEERRFRIVRPTDLPFGRPK